MSPDDFIQFAQEEFPNLTLREKSSSTLMKAADIFLKVITLWRMSSFMTDFTTTLGNTIYTPSTWAARPDLLKVRTLRHELVHMRQKRRYSSVLFGLLYLFVPLPIGLAYFRMRFEKEAYEETMRAVYEDHGAETLKDKRYRSALLDYFTTAQYFWMWPFRKGLEKWYDSVVAELERSA
jgi:hypothetical protein